MESLLEESGAGELINSAISNRSSIFFLVSYNVQQFNFQITWDSTASEHAYCDVFIHVYSVCASLCVHVSVHVCVCVCVCVCDLPTKISGGS